MSSFRISLCRLLAVAVLVGPAGAGAAFAQDQNFGDAAQQEGLIAGICLSQIDLGEAGCACLAESSMTDLSDAQRTYLIMTVVQPPMAERMPMASSQPDLQAIGNFLDSAVRECAAAHPLPATPPAGDTGEAPAEGGGEPQ